jgi:exopolysaccharide biosynthesis protein
LLYFHKYIKTFKNEKEAINFSIKNPGSEAIIKKEKDKFSVHSINDELSDKLKQKPFKSSEYSTNVMSFVINNKGNNNTIVALQPQTPSNYKVTNQVELIKGVTYNEFENNNIKETVRAVSIRPEQFDKFNVEFVSNGAKENQINLNARFNDKNKPLVEMNGTFFGNNLAGDAKGIINKDGKTKSGVYTRAEIGVNPDIKNRYMFAITNKNVALIKKDGLYSKNEKPDGIFEKDVKTALGGGLLLFNGNDTSLSKTVGTSKYSNELKLNNSSNFIDETLGLERNCARSAMGIMQDGSIVMVNVGEGKYHDEKEGGVSIPKLAKIMKEMGCISAIMYDGGGAPTIKVRDNKGTELANTTPDIHKAYGSNRSVFILNSK